MQYDKNAYNENAQSTQSSGCCTAHNAVLRRVSRQCIRTPDTSHAKLPCLLGAHVWKCLPKGMVEDGVQLSSLHQPSMSLKKANIQNHFQGYQ